MTAPPVTKTKMMTMKKYTLIIIAALSLFGCRKTDISTDVESGFIAFAVKSNWDDSEKLSRGLVSSETDMRGSSFGVVARFSSGSSYSYANSYTSFSNDVPIGYSGSAWTYSPLRYWHPGCTYRFRAVWPKNAVTTFSDDLESTMALTGFTVSSVQANQVDLMLTDRVERTTPATIPDNYSAVALSFQHLLCCVNVKIAKHTDADDDDTFTVTGVSLSGMKNSGTYNLASGDAKSGTWDVSTGGNMICTRNLSPALTLQKTVWSNIDPIWPNDGLLLIPQDLSNVKLLVSYSITHDGNTTQKSVSIDLPTTSPWTAGNKLMYQLSINEKYQIVMGTPEVKPWGTSPSTGSILIK